MARFSMKNVDAKKVAEVVKNTKATNEVAEVAEVVKNTKATNKVAEVAEKATADVQDAKAGEKLPVSAYQLFISEQVALLQKDPANSDKKYMELRGLANAMWKNQTEEAVQLLKEAFTAKYPNPRPRAKKVKKEAASDSDSDETGKKKKRVKRVKDENKPKSAYILFVQATLKSLKEQFADAADKPNQKELMKLAAQKWNEHKATLVAA